MKDKAIELLEEYLESKDIHPHFSTDIVSLYEGDTVHDYQVLTWEIEPTAMFIYRVEMNSGISTFSSTLTNVGFSDCKSITDSICKVVKEYDR